MVFVRDHHDVRFGVAACSGNCGMPAHASAPADSVFTSDNCTALAPARAAVLAQLASGELEGFVMLTRPALAPPWGARYHIAEMRFAFAHSTAPSPPGFTVRPHKASESRVCRPCGVPRQVVALLMLLAAFSCAT